MLSEDKKVAIDLSKAESIIEYGVGSKIRIIIDDIRTTKDFWVKETPEQICQMANALRR